MREVKGGKVGDGPVVYWMCRDQRVADNWALIYAAEQAKKGGKPLAVCYNVDPAFLDQGARQPVFMLRGLQEMPAKVRLRQCPACVAMHRLSILGWIHSLMLACCWTASWHRCCWPCMAM